MIKVRNFLIAIVVIIVGGAILARQSNWGSNPHAGGRQYGRQPVYDPLKHDKSKLIDGLNYRMLWEPDGDHGGPDQVFVDWGQGPRPTMENPYWRVFPVAKGTPMTVRAHQAKQKGRAPGWIEAWFIDKDGKLLDHCGPTDALQGCGVHATAP